MANTEKKGVIVSNKMEKTAVVEVEYKYRHPFYSKIVVRTRRYLAHDELNQSEIGDQVIMVSSRPLSRKKRWVIQKILNKSLILN